MTEPRKSTVYDYSDLRLHPDGTRVYQKSTNLRPKLAQCTVQNARSNWIATDAGGSANVPLFIRKQKKKKDDGLEEEEAEEDGNGSVSGSADSDDGVDEKKGKRRSAKRPDHRAAKRQKFMNSDNYLEGESNPNLAESDTSALHLAHPSPDLLKCIHMFASKFYTERGQLLNSSRQYRKEKKERRIKRAMERDSTSPSSSSRLRSKSVDGGEEEDSEGDEDEDVDTTTVKTKSRKRRKGRHRNEKLYVDMYKVFDGSAMMALGMLVQEHIAHLLNPSVPESWEGEIRSAYVDPWGEAQVGDNKMGEVSREVDEKLEASRIVVDGGTYDSGRSESESSPEDTEHSSS